MKSVILGESIYLQLSRQEYTFRFTTYQKINKDISVNVLLNLPI